MAKTSQRVKQARPAKFKTREYTRCRKCGRIYPVVSDIPVMLVDEAFEEG